MRHQSACAHDLHKSIINIMYNTSVRKGVRNQG